MDGISHGQEPFGAPLLPERVAVMAELRGVRVVGDLLPIAPRHEERRPTSFTLTFGLKMIELHMRQLLANAKGLSPVERAQWSHLLDGIEAAHDNDPDSMRDALDAASEMERCGP